MKKINGGYLSFYEYYLAYQDPALIHHLAVFTYLIGEILSPRITIDPTHRTPYGDRYNEHPRGKWTDQFLGAWQPFVAMANDVQYTFEPYKSTRDALNDIAQPLRGIKNILRGVANLIAVPLLWPINFFRYIIIAHSMEDFKSKAGNYTLYSATWLIDGVTSIVRGVSQILTTPLTWFIKLPVRVGVTFFKGKPYIRENEEIQRLLHLGKLELVNDLKNDSVVSDTIDSINAISHRLHEEYQKAEARGQPSDITADIEQNRFVTATQPRQNKEAFAIYLCLFSEDIATVNEYRQSATLTT